MKLSKPEQILVSIVRDAFLASDVGTSFPSALAIDWNAVCDSAWRDGLAPLFYRALQIRDLDSGLPANWVHDLRAAYLHTTVINMALHHELQRLLALFRNNHIRIVLLKGCALAESLYPDIGLRPMADIDVLIPKAEILHVSKFLNEQGYVPYLELVEGFQRSLENEQAFIRNAQPSVTLDVHWHLLSESYYFDRVPIDWFWQRTTEIRIGDQSALTFSSEAQLIYLMSHYVIHHGAEGLRWSFDLALLLSRYRDQMKWDEIADAARRFGLSQILDSTLEAINEVWGISPPPEARQVLEKARPNVGERLSFAVFTARHPDARTLWDALSMPSAREKLAYVHHTLLPSKVYMQTRYGIQDSRLVPVYHVLRLAKGLGMFVRSVFSIILNSIAVVLHVNQRRLPGIRGRQNRLDTGKVN